MSDIRNAEFDSWMVKKKISTYSSLIDKYETMEHRSSCQLLKIQSLESQLQEANERLAEYEKAQNTSASGWVSVEERLPEDYQYVLTWNGEYRVIDKLMPDNEWENYRLIKQIEPEEYRNLAKITHWQSLPPAPGENK